MIDQIKNAVRDRIKNAERMLMQVKKDDSGNVVAEDRCFAFLWEAKFDAYRNVLHDIEKMEKGKQ